MAPRATRRALVATARNYLDTPFAHQGRVRGVGIDCAGLLICVARDLELFHGDVTGYAPVPDERFFLAACERLMTRIELRDVQPGDVVTFDLGAETHLAIVSEMAPMAIVHVWAQAGRCVEHALDAVWRRRLRGAWAIPGVV